MKLSILALSACGALVASPLFSQTFTDRVISTLETEGFQTLEVKNGPTETKVEAVRGGTKLEVVYDRATGAIVEQETERFVGTLSPNQIVEVKNEDRDFSDRARGRDRDDDDDDRDDEDDQDDRDDDRDDRDDDRDNDDHDGDRDDDDGDSDDTDSDDGDDSDSDDGDEGDDGDDGDGDDGDDD